MQKLWTEDGRALSGTSWEVYPRPQLVRTFCTRTTTSSALSI